MKKLTILCLVFLAPIITWSQNYLDIFSKDLNECKRATALACIEAFEEGNIEQMALFLTQGSAFDVEEVTNHRKQLSGNISGSLSYHENNDTTYYKRVYSTFQDKERIYLLELSIHFEKDSPFVFKGINLSAKINLPQKLKRRLKELDQANKEQGRKLVERFKPLPPPLCPFTIGNRNKGQATYLYNDFPIAPSYFNDAAAFNKSVLPLHLTIIIQDSISLSPAFIQLKRVEQLDIYTYRINHIPDELFELQGLKILHLRISKTDSISIPSAIKNLQSLEELTIHCTENVGNIQLPEALTELNSLKRFRYSGEDIDAVGATTRAVIHAVYSKQGVRLAD